MDMGPDMRSEVTAFPCMHSFCCTAVFPPKKLPAWCFPRVALDGAERRGNAEEASPFHWLTPHCPTDYVPRNAGVQQTTVAHLWLGGRWPFLSFFPLHCCQNWLHFGHRSDAFTRFYLDWKLAGSSQCAPVTGPNEFCSQVRAGKWEAVESPLVTAELLHSVSLYIEKPEHVFIVHSRYSRTCHLFHVCNVKYEMYVK